MSHSTKAAPMTRDETMILVQLVAANKIINSKATNATNNKLKEQAWQDLTDQFNSSVTRFPRTSSQLRLKWENLKKSARKRCATMKSSCNKTGGGKEYFPPDEILDKVASLLGNTCLGFSVEFGGDATSSNLNLNLGEEVETNNDDDGVCEGGVAQNIQVIETQIVEKSTPTNQTFFSNKASGSSSLAKRKHKLEEEKCKARISRDNALADYLILKKKKVELELQEKEIIIAKLQVELENAKLENLKLKNEINK